MNIWLCCFGCVNGPESGTGNEDSQTEQDRIDRGNADNSGIGNRFFVSSVAVAQMISHRVRIPRFSFVVSESIRMPDRDQSDIEVRNVGDRDSNGVAERHFGTFSFSRFIRDGRAPDRQAASGGRLSFFRGVPRQRPFRRNKPQQLMPRTSAITEIESGSSQENSFSNVVTLISTNSSDSST